MSIYKGGYILQDISDKELNEYAQDLLSQELKDYVLKFIDENSHFKKEILLKPIKLIVKDIHGFTSLLTFNQINDEDIELQSNYIAGSVSVCVSINTDGLIASTRVILTEKA